MYHCSLRKNRKSLEVDVTKKYTGLPKKLREAVHARDHHRCRWCGVTNSNYDIHHVRYRRGFSDDVIDNLINMCRSCHTFVHTDIPKTEAQEILHTLISDAGQSQTGIALWRRNKRRQDTRIGLEPQQHTPNPVEDTQ